MSDRDGKGEHQTWWTTRETRERGVPSDRAVQSFGFKNISEVVLCRGLFVWVDKPEQGLSY